MDEDADINSQIKYSIDFGNDQKYFSIDESTGAITLKKIIALKGLPSQEFLLVITATDGRNCQYSEVISISRSLG